MKKKKIKKLITEDSPSVQVHLNIFQNVIERMSSNSNSCKAWCITIVSAVLVIVADKGKPNFTMIAFIPTVLFLFLDAYYLALERGFRTGYNDFVEKLHSDSLEIEDLYTVKPKGNQTKQQLESLMSFSIWGFYIVICILILITKLIIN